MNWEVRDHFEEHMRGACVLIVEPLEPMWPGPNSAKYTVICEVWKCDDQIGHIRDDPRAQENIRRILAAGRQVAT